MNDTADVNTRAWTRAHNQADREQHNLWLRGEIIGRPSIIDTTTPVAPPSW